MILALLTAISPSQGQSSPSNEISNSSLNASNATDVSYSAMLPNPWARADPGSCFVLPVTVGRETSFNVSVNATDAYPVIDSTFGAPTGSFLSQVRTENGRNVRTFQYQALHGQEGYTFKVCFLTMTDSSSSSSPSTPSYCSSGPTTSLPSSATADQVSQKLPFLSELFPFCVYLYVYSMDISVNMDSDQPVSDLIDSSSCLINKYIDVGLNCYLNLGISYVQTMVQDFSKLEYLPTYMNYTYGDYNLSFTASNTPSCIDCKTPSRSLPLSVETCWQLPSPTECCGNNVCDGAETSLTCPQDCQTSRSRLRLHRVNDTFSQLTFQPDIYTQGRRLLLCLAPVLQGASYQQYLINSVTVNGRKTCDNRICFILYVNPCRFCILDSLTVSTVNLLTLEKISRTIFNDMDWVKFYNYNPQISNPDHLQLREVINTGVTYRIKAGDDLILIAG